MEKEIELQAQDIYGRVIKKIQEKIRTSSLTQEDIAGRCGLEQPSCAQGNSIYHGIQ